MSSLPGGTAAASQSDAKTNDQIPKKKNKGALDPAEIEAKRKARAEKKEREAREKAQREAEAAANGVSVPLLDSNGKPLFQPRQWASVPGVEADPSRPSVRLLTWNMLAQGLVRRKVFPGSDALRWKDREAGLAAELVGHEWDVGCFQEVDRLECHAETLRKAGYSYAFSKGYSQKQHGLMLAWRSSAPAHGPPRALFEREPVSQSTFFYDDAELSPGRSGSSRITRNIAFFAALKYRDREGGIVLATTHLFWHPMHAYERVRQAGLLIRALDEYRKQPGAEWLGWPAILAGDFNDQPHSASYRLLTGMGLDAHGEDDIRQSRVVHQSVDDREKRRREGVEAAGKVPESTTAEGPAFQSQSTDDAEDEEAAEGEEEDEEGGADDQMLKNCRAATDADGLLTLDEIARLFDLSQPPLAAPQNGSSVSQVPTPVRSAYASAYRLLTSPSEEDNLFSSPARGRERWDDSEWKEGDLNVHRHLDGTAAGNEPMWTLYSSLFSLTLDFIFLLPNEEGHKLYPQVTKLLRTHRTDVVQDGLPRKGVCVSDHVAIGAELQL